MSALVLLGILLLCGCGSHPGQLSSSAEQGREKIIEYGCASCHTIPGIRGASALVGPSLEHIASRSYIAGVLPNTRRNMLTWLQNPPAVDDKTAMPNLGIGPGDAERIANYLDTLR